MADPYDFQIESMKFRLGITDQTPYVRTTAPFRKEQFDSSPTVGDQSLTGWWTRGQLSFHRGAGLNYYEVLEGETVLNRFSSSADVEVFRELGEASVSVQPQDISYAGSYVKSISTDALLALSWVENGVASYRGTPTSTTETVAMNGGYTPKLVTYGAFYFFWVTTGTVQIQKFADTTYQSTIYTHTEEIVGIWYGKDRLWIMDAAGDIFAVSRNPSGTLPATLGTPIVTMQSDSKVTFTDGGSAVFMSAGDGNVYAFTPDADGSVPTLTAPIVVASMPPTETVICIRAHMGYLAMATTRGVRFAVINDTQLTTGPLVVEWANTRCKTIGVRGSSVYVTGQDDNDDLVSYEFDLTEALDNNSLIFPYREAWRFPGYSAAALAYCGAIEHGIERTGMAFYGRGSSTHAVVSNASRTTLEPSGTITTGYHRFGTLDPKRFQKVAVRASGSGTIQVYQVEADGTETSLGTMNASAGEGTFAFTTTDPVERMALKFVLTRDSVDTTAGPTLLGYQIKALPIPERQRLLRVPLQLHDKITLRRKTRVGHVGKAFEDIAALEALEKNQAVVTFTDHRTGETGTAYIDQVDFQGQTPPSENTNGFAGIAYVTLRVLS